jgi:hypothetical protein
MEIELGDESNNKSQQLVELSQTENMFLHHSRDVTSPTCLSGRIPPHNFPTNQEENAHSGLGGKVEVGRCESVNFRANFRKSRSLTLLAVECSAASTPFFDLDKWERAEDSDEFDDDCSPQCKSSKGVKHNFPSTSTHSTSSAGSVSQSIVQLRRKLKDRSTANRRPIWSSSLTSSITAAQSKKQDHEMTDGNGGCIENGVSRRSRMGSAQSCADVDKRAKRISKSSASCAEADKTPRSRRSSSASVQIPSRDCETVVKSRRSSGSSVQGIITFVAEATSNHKRSPPSTQTGRSSLLSRLPSSRIGRRSSATSDAGDSDPPLLGADRLSIRGRDRRSSIKSSNASVLQAAKEEIQQRSRKDTVTPRLDRRSLTTMQ